LRQCSSSSLLLYGCTHSDDSAVELEALGLTEEDSTVLLVGLGCLESGLVHVGVELVTLSAWVESLEAVLLKCVHEDSLGHLETRVKVQKVLVATVELLLGHNRKGTIEVVNAVEQVSGEALEGKVLGRANLTLGLLLQVAVLGDLTLPFVLQLIVSALLFCFSIVSVCANEP
jgi:hypothetical protein